MPQSNNISTLPITEIMSAMRSKIYIYIYIEIAFKKKIYIYIYIFAEHLSHHSCMGLGVRVFIICH